MKKQRGKGRGEERVGVREKERGKESHRLLTAMN